MLSGSALLVRGYRCPGSGNLSPLRGSMKYTLCVYVNTTAGLWYESAARAAHEIPPAAV